MSGTWAGWLALLSLSTAAAQLEVRVTLPGLGALLGTVNKTLWTGREVFQFRGVPFAKPPSGPRRFKAPEPAGGWSGTLDAREFRRSCPQSSSMDELESLKGTAPWEDIEDCLHLNLYTTLLPDVEMKKCKKLKPVMFYIHGGSFRVGSGSSFRPDYLLERDVVLVVTQYRLGPLGFLSFQNDDVSGNMGLLDMLLALEWVQDHIAGVCGDPDRVTLFGQSSGGAAVSLLMASPLSSQPKKLFHRSIVQSGSALCDWALELHPEVTARGVATIANCTGTDRQMVDCLRNASVRQVLQAHLKYLRTVLVEERMAVGGRIGGNHAVVQGPWVPAHRRVLPESPKSSYSSGRIINVPLMAGFTKHEGSFFLGNIYDFLEEIDVYMNNSDFLRNKMVNTTLQFSGIIDTTGALTDVFTDRFFAKDQLGNFTAMTPGLVDMCGVTLLKSCTVQVARSHYSRAPTYLYSFNFLGHLTKFGYGEEVHYPFTGGVAHSDDLVYLFPIDKGNLTDEERRIALTMVTLWTNFAEKGDPNPILETRWEPMTWNYGPYLRLDRHSSLRDDVSEEYAIARLEGLGREPPVALPRPPVPLSPLSSSASILTSTLLCLVSLGVLSLL